MVGNALSTPEEKAHLMRGDDLDRFFAGFDVQEAQVTRRGPGQEVVPLTKTRGDCPMCGAALVVQLYYLCGKAYLITYECWRGTGEAPLCPYRTRPA